MEEGRTANQRSAFSLSFTLALYISNGQSRYDGQNPTPSYTDETRIPTVKLNIPGKLFLNAKPELLLHSSYSF